MGLLGWLLQWPVRALVLLLVASMPLGVELAGFQSALLSAVTIGLLGTLLILPLKLLLSLPWALTSLGGLIAPVSWLFDWLITVILFGLAASLIDGFRLKQGCEVPCSEQSLTASSALCSFAFLVSPMLL